MAEENKKPKEEKKDKIVVEHAHTHEHPHKEEKVEHAHKEEVKSDADNKDNKEKSKKKEEKVISKKDEAVVHAHGMHASKRQCMYICRFIKNKTIDSAIADLEDVIKFKRAIPFKGEIPHRKGKGMMSGRYPIKVSKMFITLLKGLKGNTLVNGMDLDKTRIAIASASWASRPMRGGGTQGKRSHVNLIAKEIGGKHHEKK